MKRKILVIDDDKDDLGIFYEALKRISDSDFDCTYSESAIEALELLRYLTPDYIFIDHNMPVLNGLQLLGLLTNEKSLSSAKKFILSTSINPDSHQQAIMLGATGCLEKADSVDELSRRLRKIFYEEVKNSMEHKSTV